MKEFKGSQGKWGCVFTSDKKRAVRNKDGIICILTKPIRYSGQDEMTREDRRVHKILLGIMAFLGLWLISSCTTSRNAPWRHDRIVKNFPNVHKVDTVTVEKVDTIRVTGINGSDTLYFTVNSIDTIRDTFYLNNEVKVINTIWRTKDGQNVLKTDVSQPDQKIVYRWKERTVKIYEKIPLKWWQRGWVAFSILVVGCVSFWFFAKLDSNLNNRFNN